MFKDYLIAGFWISIFKTASGLAAKPTESSPYAYQLNIITSGIQGETLELLAATLKERIQKLI